MKSSAFALLILFFWLPVASAQTVKTLLAPGANVGDDIALGPDGFLYVSDFARGGVTKVSMNGTATNFASGFVEPNGLAFRPDGSLLVANASGNRINRVDPQGNSFVFRSSINNPTGMLLLPDGNLLVAHYRTSTISMIDTDGNLSQFMSGSSLNGPVGLDMDEAGNLYIGNFNDGRIIKRTPDGETTVIGDIPGWLGFIAYNNGWIYASAFQINRIYRVRVDGTDQEIFAGNGRGETADGDALSASFHGPNGLAASITGDTLFVSEFNGRSIRMITGINAVSTSNEDESNPLPEGFGLRQNYPNPFNPSTAITFDIPSAGHVKINVFDRTGRLISALADQRFAGGSHTLNFEARNLASGVYFYSMEYGGQSTIRKMALLK